MGLLQKGTTNKNTQQTNKPPSWAAPILEQGAKDAHDLYLEQKGKDNIYKGDRVADLSQITKEAINSLQELSKKYNNSYAGQVLGNKTASEKNLEKIASGQTIGQNPNFDTSLKQSLETAAQTINSQMSGAGRYGSGANANILAKTLGSIATDAKAKQYNQDLDHMLNANQLMDQAQNNKINSTNSYYKGQGDSILHMLTGGRVLDNHAQNKETAKQQEWYEKQQNAWDQINKLLEAGRKAAGNYGSQYSSSSKQSTNQPDLTDYVDSASKLIPLLTKSDRRCKEILCFYGYKNGFPLYVFRYLGEQQLYLGVIAQEIEPLLPEAVFYDEQEGFLKVNYQKLGLEMRKLSPFFWRVERFFVNFFNLFKTGKKLYDKRS